MDYRKHIEKYCKEEQLYINISNDMPEGYENAFGTFDVVLNTLFINEKIIGDYPEYERLFLYFSRTSPRFTIYSTGKIQ